MANERRAGKIVSTKSGPYEYDNYGRNHVIWPGREAALAEFVHQTYKERSLKLKHACSSHSEDALTWSCFDSLRQVKAEHRERALEELWEIAYDGARIPAGIRQGEIFIGKQYPSARNPDTEVDVSIEGPRALVFIEAKLYSTISQADPPAKPYNQLERKLRAGVREAAGRDFFFVVLDLAPPQMLREMNPRASLEAARTARARGFPSKWLTAYWFDRYNSARGRSITPLRRLLEGLPAVDGVNADRIAGNLGWLTWGDVFKAVLRAVIADRTPHGLPTA